MDSAISLNITSNHYHVISACQNCSVTLVTHGDHVLVGTLYRLGTETGADGACTRNRLDVFDGPIVNQSALLSGIVCNMNHLDLFLLNKLTTS